MRSAVTRSLLFLVSFTITVNAAAQTTPTSAPKIPGTIAGRVTAASQPAAGVEVLLRPGGEPTVMDYLNVGPATTTTTDSEGWYRLTNVAPGTYRLAAYAPAYVIEGDSNPFMPGKTVNVGEGEAIENVNFAITRGGVLTGKVTDPYGRPVISELVSAYKLNAGGKRNSPGFPDFSQWKTDDRGIYRIFGLEPGRYIVAAGASSEDAMLRMSLGGGTHYSRTFHPDAVEEAQARIIEIRSGDETENIDIKLAATSKGKVFAATGRVIDAESGKPVAGMMIGYGAAKAASPSFGIGNSATNSQGEFRLEGLTPNTYRAYVIGPEASENYGEQLEFEISGSDVAGLEIKMHPGVSISGVAIIEGSSDPKLLEKLSNVQLFPHSYDGSAQSGMAIALGRSKINPNGTFKIGGVRPGRIRLDANTSMADRGLSLLRIEHNGVAVKELQLSAGERATGVRLVFVYGTASIGGRVEVRGGVLPPNMRLIVIAVREGASGGQRDVKIAEVDARGQFLIEGLSQGIYKLRINSSAESAKLPDVEQPVSVAGNARQEVTLVVDLSKKEKK